jgi:hypothetical protein
MAYMHVNYAVTQHGTGYSANTLASQYASILLILSLLVIPTMVCSLRQT